jgi:hypothetical protein
MDSPSSWVFVAVAVAFVVYIAVQARPRWKARRELAAEVRVARDRAHAATNAHDRAMALCDAARLAAGAHRWTATAGFLLRAMRTDPTSAEAVQTCIDLLARPRPRLLEKVLWRRLAQLPWDEEHRDAARTSAAGLVRVYRGRRTRQPARAEVLERLATRL